MRRPAVDYRALRPNNITSPQYRHLLLLLGWPCYFIPYFLTENLIPPENCFPIHCTLDDLIPFCELFVIPYVGWYLLIIGALSFFAFYDVKNFRRLQTYIMITQAVAMLIYILFPSRQDLRPLVFPRENIFTAIMNLIYTVDSNTGVFPSLHVAYSIGIASTWLRADSVSKSSKVFICVFCFLVCLSTVFVKQHSAADIFAALPVCLLAEWLVFLRPNQKSKSPKPCKRRTIDP